MKIPKKVRFAGLLILVGISLQIIVSTWWSSSDQIADLELWLNGQDSVTNTYGTIETFRVIRQTSVLAGEGKDNPYDLYTVKISGDLESGTIRVKVGDSPSSWELVSASLD